MAGQHSRGRTDLLERFFIGPLTRLQQLQRPAKRWRARRFHWLVLLAFSASAWQVLLPSQEQNTGPLKLVWRTALEAGGNPPIGTPVVTKGGRLIATYTGIHAYSIADGRTLWQVAVRKYLPRSLVAKGEVVFVAESTVYALDGKNGHRLWEFTPDANASLGRAAVHDDTIFFGTSSHRVYALRAFDGRKRWVVDVGKEWQYPATVRGVAVSEGKVYATVEQWRTENGLKASGWMVALDARSGRVLWRSQTGSGDQRRGLSSSPVIASNLVLAGDYISNSVVAVSRNTGNEVWRFAGESGFVGFAESPIVKDDLVYAASGDRFVYALDLTTGRQLWRTQMPGANESYALCGDSLLVKYQGLAALDPHSGRIKQTLFGYDAEGPTSALAVSGSQVFALGPNAVYGFSCH